MLAALGFLALLFAFWLVGQHFGVADKLGGHLPSTLISFSLLLAPHWAFGFGFAEWLRKVLPSVAARTLAPSLLVLPYLVFTIPRGLFQWSMCLGLLGSVLLVALILSHARAAPPDWHDALVLLLLALAVELHYFDGAWRVPGLSGLPKLLFVDLALYGYLVIRPLEGIGFDFRVRASDLWTGLREFLLFTPIALGLGLLLGFLHVHWTLSNPLAFGAGWLFTLFFIAIPEELFFRGLLLNLLERRIGVDRALWVSAVIFGVAHFNKRTAFVNWRYVILASIAGLFYGRAWLVRRRVAASSITHATVDTVWSIWLR